MSQTSKPDFSNVSGAKPDFGNVRGGVRSTEAPAGTSPGRSKSHTVASGDTLSDIAQRYYGNANWQPIFDANRDQLDDPDKIRPGQVLDIPAA